jgi:hypothetical protein
MRYTTPRYGMHVGKSCNQRGHDLITSGSQKERHLITDVCSDDVHHDCTSSSLTRVPCTLGHAGCRVVSPTTSARQLCFPCQLDNRVVAVGAHPRTGDSDLISALTWALAGVSIRLKPRPLHLPNRAFEPPVHSKPPSRAQKFTKPPSNRLQIRLSRCAVLRDLVWCCQFLPTARVAN